VGQIGRLKQARHSVNAARQKCSIVGATRKETLDACANVRFANGGPSLGHQDGRPTLSRKRKETEVVLKATSWPVFDNLCRALGGNGNRIAWPDIARFPFDAHPSGAGGYEVDFLGLGVIVLLGAAACRQACLSQAAPRRPGSPLLTLLQLRNERDKRV